MESQDIWEFSTLSPKVFLPVIGLLKWYSVLSCQIQFTYFRWICCLCLLLVWTNTERVYLFCYFILFYIFLLYQCHLAWVPSYFIAVVIIGKKSWPNLWNRENHPTVWPIIHHMLTHHSEKLNIFSSRKTGSSLLAGVKAAPSFQLILL